MAVFFAASDWVPRSAAARALAIAADLGEVGLASAPSATPSSSSSSSGRTPRSSSTPNATPSASRTSSKPRSCMNSSNAPGASRSESAFPSPDVPTSPLSFATPSVPGSLPASPNSRNLSREPSNGFLGSSVVGTPSGSTTTSWPWESCNAPDGSAGGSSPPPNPPSGHHAGRSAMASPALRCDPATGADQHF